MVSITSLSLVIQVRTVISTASAMQPQTMNGVRLITLNMA